MLILVHLCSQTNSSAHRWRPQNTAPERSTHKLVKPCASQPMQIQHLTFAGNFRPFAQNRNISTSTRQPTENTSMIEAIPSASSEIPTRPLAPVQLVATGNLATAQVARSAPREPIPPAVIAPTPPNIFFFSTDFLQAFLFSAKYTDPDTLTYRIAVRLFLVARFTSLLSQLRYRISSQIRCDHAGSFSAVSAAVATHRDRICAACSSATYLRHTGSTENACKHYMFLMNLSLPQPSLHAPVRATSSYQVI